MAIQEVEAESISKLIEIILEIQGQLPVEHNLWFRGVGNHNHKLLPKIMRGNKSSEQVFEREKRLVTRFRQRSMAYWPEGYPQNDWEHFFAMQHYGLSTRLLDWSENAFVASFFAISYMPNENADEIVYPIVWCMDPVKWNRSMPGLSEYGDSIRVLTTVDDEIEGYRPETTKRRSRSPVAMFGAHNSDRIVAQRGTFTVWGSDTQDMESFADAQQPTLLWKIKLTGERSRLYKDLQALGFSETMIFPDLPSLALELDRVEGWRE
ncbi:FRG domain-containing protein [Pseudomonas sp. URMO17WK12:I4]|uniref:FRG domain-containing protein n=1 Tax=Pseudomonas sp. URMO17WK12:I4 TaxID=1283292 RepID=UPI000568C319|nr:FRG domain-containing protein [Pseudomonas sp. URMO17WK12:I4]